MKKQVLAITLLAALAASALAPSFGGSAQAAAPAVRQAQAHAALFDKTRFLLHMGLAFYAFHHFIYTPFRAHAFASGASHRTSSIVKAGIAALFAAHEVKVAYGIAKGSNSATLKALIAPIDKLAGTFASAGATFKNNPGAYTDTPVNSMNGSVNYIGSTAQKGGYGIKDVVTHIPGL